MNAASNRSKPLLIVGAIVLLNGLGYAAYRATRPAQPEEDASPDARKGSSEARDVSEAARQAKLTGLDAMERGDYAAAVKAFTQAVREGDESPELMRLLGLAQDLWHKYGDKAAPKPGQPSAEAGAQGGQQSAAPVAVAVPAAELTAVREAVARARRAWTPRRRPSSRRSAARPSSERRAPEEAPAAPEPLAAADPEAAEADTDVAGGGAGSSEPAAPSEANRPEPSVAAPPPDPEPAPVAAAPTPQPPAPPPQPRPTTTPPPSPPARPATPAPAPPRATGSLEIISPNVYGEVWVNGRRRGYPPVVVRDVPVGRARVEIRVDGEVRRSKTVRVREGRKVRVRLW